MTDHIDPSMPDDPDDSDDPDDKAFERLEAELGRLARELEPEDSNLAPPPADLWSRIEAEVGSDRTIDRTAEAEAEAGAGSADVVDLTTRRPNRWLPALAAAAVVVLVASVAALTSRGDDPVLLASAEITNEGLPVTLGGAGTARVHRDGDDLFLQLDLPDLPTDADPSVASYYEVWMIDTNVEGMVSLGAIPADGRVDLPDNMDHTAFPVVDISVEPLDGDPTHSGQSILRGVLAVDEEAGRSGDGSGDDQVEW